MEHKFKFGNFLLNFNFLFKKRINSNINITFNEEIIRYKVAKYKLKNLFFFVLMMIQLALNQKMERVLYFTPDFIQHEQRPVQCFEDFKQMLSQIDTWNCCACD